MSHAHSLQGANRLILETLRQSNKPLGAYDLLSALGAHGVKNPPTVYRALKRLVTLGLAHRVASLNAYVACRREHKNHVVGFVVCRNCKHVEAFDDASLDAVIQKLGNQRHFQTEQRVVELVGICQECAEINENDESGGEAGTCSI
ncbi:MAG: transcriptional repressor [Alphaproteobacteria bacterium]